ncbi:hypothetical protein JW823_02075 [bacterium]|nr:hypothetical protein [candidate division CSSED10-310 bacterium]
MSLVNFLRFNDDSGAIISDEEYWNVFFRKRMHGDNLHNVLHSDISAKLGIQCVYGGVGYPSVHREVVEKTRERIEQIILEKGVTAIRRVKDVARIAFDCLQEAIRIRIDQKMQFYYGFKTQDLNAGQFTVQGETFPIETAVVKENARKLASRETQDTLLKVVIEAKAAVFGFDENGITGYYLAGENSIMGYVHEGFEAIGTGKYASGLVFGQDFKAKTLKMRQQGYSPPTGLFELIDSAFLAGEHFKEVGGNYNFVLLDRKAATAEQQYRQVFDNEARLATEIVRAVRTGYIQKKQGIDLLNRLVFKKQDVTAIEKSLFEKARDRNALDLVLRGYKNQEVASIFSVETGDQTKTEGV